MSKEEVEAVFMPGYIPRGLQQLFEIEYTPSSLLRYDPDAWELPEIQRSLSTLRRLREDDGPGFEWCQAWADRELEAAFAAVRRVRGRGRNPGKELDRELLEEFEHLKQAFETSTPIALGTPTTPAPSKYKMAPILLTPGRAPSPPESSYAILAELFGLSEANVKIRISRARSRAGKSRRRPSERKGPVAESKARRK